MLKVRISLSNTGAVANERCVAFWLRAAPGDCSWDGDNACMVGGIEMNRPPTEDGLIDWMTSEAS